MPNEPLPPDLEAMARETCESLDPDYGGHECGKDVCSWCPKLLAFAERVRRETVEWDCLWAPDEDDGSWNSECGAKWVFNDGSPEENGMVFCPACGGRAAFAEPGKEGE